MHKKTIYILGNELLETDTIPIKIVPELQKLFPSVQFTHIDPTEEFPETAEKNLLLIDTVIGIQKPERFEGLDVWQRSPRVSVHDFDLPVELGLMKKLGKIESVTIIGVPQTGDLKRITDLVSAILTTI